MKWIISGLIIFAVSEVIYLAILKAWNLDGHEKEMEGKSEDELVSISDAGSTKLKYDPMPIPVHGLYPQFIHSDDFPSEANNGDMLVKDGCVYMCRNSEEWVKMYTFTEAKDEWVKMDTITEAKDEEGHDYPTTCTHCGAPLHSHVCEYCGCEY